MALASTMLAVPAFVEATVTVTELPAGAVIVNGVALLAEACVPTTPVAAFAPAFASMAQNVPAAGVTPAPAVAKTARA